MAWRFAYRSVAGRSHVGTGLPCQDASLCTLLQDGEAAVLVVSISDGAGSAARSEVGSHLACASFLEQISAFVREHGTEAPPERSYIETWLIDLSSQIAHAAEQLDLPPRELACTLVGAVIAPNWSAFCQVGDGGIVVNAASSESSTQQGGPITTEFEIVFWPEQGEYANETYFATQPGAVEHLQFCVQNRQVREIALFSDGLQRLVLSYATQQPFVPFFRGMFAPIRSITDCAGEAPQLSLALAEYLGSPIVSERTDDDVSVILATQRDADELADSGQPGSATDAAAPSTAQPPAVTDT